MTQTQDANTILMSGGAGLPAWKFTEPITRESTIVAPPQARQEREYDPVNPGAGAGKVFPSGDPIMGILVEVQTDERDDTDDDDDGRRTFYIEGRWLKEAVREGVRASGAAGLEVGARLRVAFTHREDPLDKRSRKYWQVTYTPAGNAALMTDPAPPAPTAANGAPTQAITDPVETAKQLIKAGLPDHIIHGTTGLDGIVIAALRMQQDAKPAKPAEVDPWANAQTDDPPF